MTYTHILYMFIYIFKLYSGVNNSNLNIKYKRELKPIVKSTLKNKTRKEHTYIIIVTH